MIWASFKKWRNGAMCSFSFATCPFYLRFAFFFGDFFFAHFQIFHLSFIAMAEHHATTLNIIPIEIFNFPFFVSARLFACRHLLHILSPQILIFIFDQNELSKSVKRVEWREQASTLTQTDYKILFGAHFRHSTATFHFELSSPPLYPLLLFLLHRRRLVFSLAKTGKAFACHSKEKCITIFLLPYQKMQQHWWIFSCFFSHCFDRQQKVVVVVAKTWSFIGFLFIDYTIIIAWKIFLE